jgi:hypothetical protein
LTYRVTHQRFAQFASVVSDLVAQGEQRPSFACTARWYMSFVAGLSLGGLLVIIGIVVAIFWSVVVGIIIALVGLLAFGGFARGRWY